MNVGERQGLKHVPYSVPGWVSQQNEVSTSHGAIGGYWVEQGGPLLLSFA
jgi:hypothetical protein